jgi:signal transduction histidine kinase
MSTIDATEEVAYKSSASGSNAGDALDALRTPLAVILGEAQVLQRRVLRGELLPPDDVLAALSTIQRSVWAIEGRLRVLQDRTSQVTSIT